MAAKVIPLYATGRATNGRSARQQLRIRDRDQPGVVIDVRVSNRSRPLVRWTNPVATYLLQSLDLPLIALADGDYPCDKALLQQLTVAAASYCAAAELRAINNDAGASAQRVIAAGPTRPRPTRLSGLHALILRTVRRHQPRHLDAADIACLVGLQLPCLATQQVTTALTDLAAWRLVQCIVCPDGRRFFDANTRPHLHVYDAANTTLYDAPETGVLVADCRQSGLPALPSL